MKKYIFTIAFALLGITSSMASKADTLRIYTIDGKLVLANGTLNDINSLGKGLYILNGVKVLVK